MRLYIAVDIDDPSDELAEDSADKLSSEIVAPFLPRLLRDDGRHVEYKYYSVKIVEAGFPQ